MSFLLCADFSIFPDNTQLGPAFTLAGTDFQDAAGAALVSFVNEAVGERGLQFPHDGLGIDVPVPVPWARTSHRVVTDTVQVRATDRDFDYAIGPRV